MECYHPLEWLSTEIDDERRTAQLKFAAKLACAALFSKASGDPQ
jgi:hypothetical protein